MRTAVWTILAASLPMVVAGVKADTVTLYWPSFSVQAGGEFTVVGTGPVNSGMGLYNPANLINGGFETFCLETGVDFTPGVTYNYTLGSVTQPSSPANNSSTGGGFSLSVGAAYLYYEFATGGLASLGFDYSTADGGRAASDDLVQAAIWALQGGQTYGGYPSGTVNNPYYTFAVNAGSNPAAVAAVKTVQVLQMWNSDGSPAQNQLVLTLDANPNSVLTPDGGLTAGLLGGAMLGLAALRRKLVG